MRQARNRVQDSVRRDTHGRCRAERHRGRPGIVRDPRRLTGLGAAGLALTARRNSAHLQLEPARLRCIADCADGDTDHLPQNLAAEQSELTANIATDTLLGSATESFIHAYEAKSVT